MINTDIWKECSEDSIPDRGCWIVVESDRGYGSVRTSTTSLIEWADYHVRWCYLYELVAVSDAADAAINNKPNLSLNQDGI